MRPLRHSLPFVALASVPSGLILGGGWTWLTVAATPLCLTGLDGLLGDDSDHPPGRDHVSYRWLPWLYIVLQLAVTAWAMLSLSPGRTPFIQALGLTASVGVTAGVFGILAAHEMVHSQKRVERGLGLMLLASVGYMHFRIAHIHGHHRRAATPLDPATARRGESAYGFIVRSIIGQVREAWAFERARLRRRGRSAWRPANRVIQYIVIEGLLIGAVALVLGPWALAAFLAQATLAVLLLELFNYVAHYGLKRRVLAAGGLERLGLAHSWNSSRRMNNWSLFNMGRHADHHRFGARPYQCLEALPQTPQLPTGYAGSILLALIPPLWRKVMDPRVDVWMGAGEPLQAATRVTPR